MEANRKILVFVDLPAGELDETGKGLLSYGARLAKILGFSWGAVIPVPPVAEAQEEFGRYGTPSVTLLDGGAELLDLPAHLGSALAALVSETGATLLLLPHNDLGATLAPVAAAKLGSALMTETNSVKNLGSAVELSRQVLGVRLAETRSWDAEQPLVMTVPTRLLSQVLLPSVKPAVPELFVYELNSAPEGATAKVTVRIPPDPQTVDLVDAEVIFSAGKGCDPATFGQLKELCSLLNVSCGVTRPVYDLGYTGFERMVGQTGRTVTPRLYVALGISGSMHHVGGIKDSRRIVSVNLDPKAPIFPNSDEGFVADVKEILPRLIDRAKTAVGGAA
ncbi:electron transfer flavoprotein subunit alpha/FixB family protein [Geomonas sp.]|uniref:electron transfer flavoprotein subunit alpha/FixB family protein n=1 Tax=Geomonas sp. TaxID=2651584 RepID=UPI002B48C818|nr:electron transfer flavoprotein subunit alpha/FixB family protein [Geomonas sp.]HJV35237.1 electron transfer flavoprotein subunit alpha/FixB family protein [Geomonas sp.]